MTEHPTEVEEACALVQWVNLQPNIRDFFIHIPNEGPRTMRFGRILKLMGLKRGVSDYLLALPVSPFHGLWLELKRRQIGIVNAEQKAWVERMQGVGYAAAIVYGWEEAKDAIEQYLKGIQWISPR